MSIENAFSSDAINKREARTGQTRLTYDDVYNILAAYCNDTLFQFADRWSRFPVGQCAKEVEQALMRQARFWKGRDADTYQKLVNAAIEVEDRAQQ